MSSTLRLQLSEPSSGDGLPARAPAAGSNAGTLERISDPLSREVYRRKAELGLEDDTFTVPRQAVDDRDDWW